MAMPLTWLGVCVVHRVVQNNMHPEVLEGRVIMLDKTVSRYKNQHPHEDGLI